MTKIAERHLTLALEIEMLPQSLVSPHSVFALILEFFIPVANSSTVLFLILSFLVFVLVLHI